MKYSLSGTFLSAAVLLSLPVSTSAGAADVFDKPLDKQVIKLPADPDNPQAKPKRSCFYYPGFMVKEVDLGEEGADELSITPSVKGGQKPLCNPKTAGEMIVKSDDWSGYFEGVKGDFVFFTAEDGVNGGLGFAVFGGGEGKKLFEDSLVGDHMPFAQLSGDALMLRYERVYTAPCSLYADPNGCWRKIKAATALAGAAGPDCRSDYEKEMKRVPKFANSTRSAKSVIGYKVEARYSGGKLTYLPLDMHARCWLED